MQENGGCGQPLTLISAPTPCGSLPQGYSPSTTDPRWASTAAALQALLSKVRPPATKPLWHKPHTDAGPMVMLDSEHLGCSGLLDQLQLWGILFHVTEHTYTHKKV